MRSAFVPKNKPAVSLRASSRLAHWHAARSGCAPWNVPISWLHRSLCLRRGYGPRTEAPVEPIYSPSLENQSGQEFVSRPRFFPAVELPFPFRTPHKAPAPRPHAYASTRAYSLVSVHYLRPVHRVLVTTELVSHRTGLHRTSINHPSPPENIGLFAYAASGPRMPVKGCSISDQNFCISIGCQGFVH